MIIALSGPSGIGKGYIKQRILQMYPAVTELIWYTTRPQRGDTPESNRVTVTNEEFEVMVAKGMLCLVQQVFGNWYGIKVGDLVNQGNHVITEIHPGNVTRVKEICPGIVLLGLVTHDVSFLRMRLSDMRRTESDSEIAERLSMAKVEVGMITSLASHYHQVFHFDGSNVDQTLEQVFATVRPIFQLP